MGRQEVKNLWISTSKEIPDNEENVDFTNPWTNLHLNFFVADTINNHVISSYGLLF